jgi:hypothetical protein
VERSYCSGGSRGVGVRIFWLGHSAIDELAPRAAETSPRFRAREVAIVLAHPRRKAGVFLEGQRMAGAKRGADFYSCRTDVQPHWTGRSRSLARWLSTTTGKVLP